MVLIEGAKASCKKSAKTDFAFVFDKYNYNLSIPYKRNPFIALDKERAAFSDSAILHFMPLNI
jgi:hypothetical protein